MKTAKINRETCLNLSKDNGDTPFFKKHTVGKSQKNFGKLIVDGKRFSYREQTIRVVL